MSADTEKLIAQARERSYYRWDVTMIEGESAVVETEATEEVHALADALEAAEVREQQTVEQHTLAVREAARYQERALEAEAEVARLASEVELNRTIIHGYSVRVGELEVEVERLTEALRQVGAIQPTTLERLRSDGIVFKHAPKPGPDMFEHVAFWIYTDLCEVEQIARAALAAGGRAGEI